MPLFASPCPADEPVKAIMSQTAFLSVHGVENGAMAVPRMNNGVLASDPRRPTRFVIWIPALGSQAKASRWLRIREDLPVGFDCHFAGFGAR
jgi:hypothetical protein